MKRAPLALAVTFAVVAVVVADSPRASSPSAQTPSGSPTATPGPIAGAVATSPLWRLDLPKGGGPVTARFSPDAHWVAVESPDGRTGTVVYEIRAPVPPSDVAQLREIVRLDRAMGPVQWLPDSSAFLVHEADGRSSPTGTMTLVGTSGKRWSIATAGVSASCPFCGARFSPDGRQVAFWVNPRGVLVVALDGTASYALGDDESGFGGWDAEGNMLFHLQTKNTIEARGPDGRVAYTIALPGDLRYLFGGVADVPQPPDRELLWFESGCCQPSHHVALVLFDRTLHEIPAEFEDIPSSIGDGPWRGRELIVRRKDGSALMAFDPRTGAARPLDVDLPRDVAIWGISGDYLAFGRRIVQLSTGREQEITVQPQPEVIAALTLGRFVFWRDGTTELLDAAAWMTAPQSWTGELQKTADQAGLPAGWVRVRDDDGGMTIARPASWSSYDGPARGAVLASSGLVPSTPPAAGEMRVEIRLDIEGPRGPADFLEGLTHHGGSLLERKTVQLAGQPAEFAMVYENTAYPKPATSLNWALRSPFFSDRIVWIRAWPFDPARRAEVESVVATLAFVAPR